MKARNPVAARRMVRTAGLGLAVLLLAGLGVALLVWSRDSRSPGAVEASAGRAHTADATRNVVLVAPGQPVAEFSPSQSAPLEAVNVAAAPQATTRRAVTPRVDAVPPVDPSKYLHVRLVLPPGTPADEPIDLVVSTSPKRTTTRVTFEDGDERRVVVPMPRSWLHARLTLDAPHLGPPEPVTVDRRSTTGEVVLAPQLGGRISGTLIMPSGSAPDADPGRTRFVSVCSLPADDPGALRITVPVDEHLHFEAQGLPAGRRLALETMASGSLIATRVGWTDEDAIVLEPCEDRQIVLQLGYGAVVRGRVVLPDGSKPEDATRENKAWLVSAPTITWVSHARGYRARSASTFAGRQGAFELTRLDPGEAFVRIEGGNVRPLWIPLGVLREGDSIDLGTIELLSGLHLDVTVHNADGSPSEDATVSLYCPTDPGWTVRRTFGHRVAVVSASDFPAVSLQKVLILGHCRFDGLAPGSYSLVATARHEDGSEWAAVREGLRAPGEVELLLEPAPSLEGQVRDAAGEAVPEFTVRLSPIFGGATSDEDRSEKGTNGRFEVGPLHPGRWRVSVEAPDCPPTVLDVELGTRRRVVQVTLAG